MKIGDRVNYLGTLTGGIPVKNCTIKNIELKGSIFNTDMAVIDKVDHWVTLTELEAITA